MSALNYLFMNISTKIITGFAIGTIAGTLLGILLNSSEKSAKIELGDGRKHLPLMQRLFGKKEGSTRRFREVEKEIVAN